METFERMKAAGFAPDHVTYTPVVDALFKLKRDDEAMEMFDEMRARGLQPRSMTYGVMLIVCSRNDMVSVLDDFMGFGCRILGFRVGDFLGFESQGSRGMD